MLFAIFWTHGCARNREKVDADGNLLFLDIGDALFGAHMLDHDLDYVESARRST